MKKATIGLLSLLLAVCLLILPMQAQAAETSGTCGDNVTWNYDAATKTLTISGTGAIDDCWMDTPWYAYENDILTVKIEDGVIAIGDKAFSDCISLISVTIPDSVAFIGSYAFSRCTSLTSVSIPKSVTTIDYNVFNGCSSLDGIWVDENNPSYHSDEHGVLFNQTELIKAPGTIVGHYTIPDSVTTIDYSAFEDCTGLTGVTIPEGVTSIRDSAFEGCTGLISVVIPEGVTSIDTSVFNGCENLTSVSIPESVTSIDNNVFNGCSSLESITIPERVTSIGFGAFENCFGMKAFYVEEGNPTYYTKDGVLYALYEKWGETVHEIVQVPGSYTGVLTIPDGVTRFYNGECGCPGITEVYLPASWTGEYCYEDEDYPGDSRNSFADCVRLTGIWVDEENETLCSNEEGVLFSKDMKILRACPPAYAGTSFEVPDGVETIGGFAFPNCANIEDLYIPASTTSIYTQNFDGCTSLMGIWVAEGNPLYMSDAYGVVYNSAYTRKEYVWIELPDEEDPNDDGTMDWVDVFHPEMTQLFFFPTGRTGCYEVPEGVTELAYDSFFGANINALILPKTLGEIVDFALSSCYNLDWILCRGDCTHTVIDLDSAVTVYYPADNETWSNVYDPFSNWSLAEVTYVGYSAGNEPVPPYKMIQESVDNPFADVPEGEYYYAPVLWAVENGITTGMDATHFAPDNTCTRAQIVTFLWRANGSPKPASSTNPFTDVPMGQWYTDAVLWAVENGITTGTSATTFSPDAGCTRGQVATFLWRAQGQPVSGGSNIFTDITPGAYYYDAVLWAVENGITNGMGDGTFAPDATCTRGQIVTFLYRAMV